MFNKTICPWNIITISVVACVTVFKYAGSCPLRSSLYLPPLCPGLWTASPYPVPSGFQCRSGQWETPAGLQNSLYWDFLAVSEFLFQWPSAGSYLSALKLQLAKAPCSLLFTFPVATVYISCGCSVSSLELAIFFIVAWGWEAGRGAVYKCVSVPHCALICNSLIALPFGHLFWGCEMLILLFCWSFGYTLLWRLCLSHFKNHSHSFYLLFCGTSLF